MTVTASGMTFGGGGLVAGEPVHRNDLHRSREVGGWVANHDAQRGR